MIPLVSVIIPTINRSQYLRRAIESSLSGMEPGEVEVIVIPNGLDTSWRDTFRAYHNNRAVQVVPIKPANANIARNTGLAEAKGKFIRFLDDDDYLIPENAINQYELLEKSDVDIISGGIKLIDEHDQCLNLRLQPDTEDFCTAVLGPWRVCLNLAHVYKRSILHNAQWNPETLIRQDVEWQLDLCAQQELSWEKTNEIVGVWQQHWGQRVSYSKKFQEIRKNTVPMLLRLYDNLQAQERLTQSRQRAMAQGLWGCIHEAFIFEPLYWSHVAHTAKKIDPTARPIQPIYNFPLVCKLNPLLIQWFLFPKRWYSRKYHQVQKKFHIKH